MAHATETVPPRDDPIGPSANGSAMAAVMAAGVGSFAVGAFVILNESGLLPAPTLYGPAGGVSGRTTMAAVTWLIVWAFLHRRWRARDVPTRPVLVGALVLIALGLLATFPPVWSVL